MSASELPEDHIRQRARRGMHPLRKEREELRMQAVGFGELARGLGTVADLARIRHNDRK